TWKGARKCTRSRGPARSTRKVCAEPTGGRPWAWERVAMKPSVLVTVQQHILEEQRRNHPHASGEFSWLLSGITLATKLVADRVRRAGLIDVLGSAGQQNVQGETVQKLDVLANTALCHCLGTRGNVGVMASEENEEPMIVARDRDHGKYVVVF